MNTKIKSIAYIGFSDDKYVEVVIGKPEHLQEILNPDELLLKIIKEKRDNYDNIRLLNFNCDTYDLWSSLICINDVTTFSSYSSITPNSVSFRGLENKLDSFLKNLKNRKDFVKENIIKFSI